MIPNVFSWKVHCFSSAIFKIIDFLLILMCIVLKFHNSYKLFFFIDSVIFFFKLTNDYISLMYTTIITLVHYYAL